MLPSAGLMRKLSQKPAEASRKLSSACNLLHNILAIFLAIIRGLTLCYQYLNLIQVCSKSISYLMTTKE
jgi:hypothetical protein